MVTVWPSCLPISEIVDMGADIRSNSRSKVRGQIAEVKLEQATREVSLLQSDLSPLTLHPFLRTLRFDFLRIFQLAKGCAYIFAGAFLLFPLDFQQQGWSLGGGAQQFHGLLPVDRSRSEERRVGK